MPQARHASAPGLRVRLVVGHRATLSAAGRFPSSTGPWIRREKRTVLETWLYVLTLGQPLPTLPLWLSEVLVIPLNLEQSYEQACHDLWIA